MVAFIGKVIGVLIAISGVLILIALFAIVMAIPTMLCWNHAVTQIWSLPHITLIQAFCLNLLAGAFFKSGSSKSNKK